MTKLISGKLQVKETANRTIQFPVIGVAAFDKDGILEVEDSKVEEFRTLTEESFDFQIVGSKKEKVPAPADGAPANDDEIDMDDLKAFEDSIKALSTQELLELVRDSDDKIFKAKAAGWADDKIRAEFIKIYKKNNKKSKKS